LVHLLLPRCLPVAAVWARQEVASSSGGGGVAYMPPVLYHMSSSIISHNFITSSIICHDSLPYYANNTHANNTCADNTLHVRKGAPRAVHPRTQAPKQRCIVSNKVRPDISMPPHTKRQPSSSAVIVCPHRRTRVCTHTHDPSVGHAARAHSLTLPLSYPPSHTAMCHTCSE